MTFKAERLLRALRGLSAAAAIVAAGCSMTQSATGVPGTLLVPNAGGTSSGGTLYVANFDGNSITAYRSGEASPAWSATQPTPSVISVLENKLFVATDTFPGEVDTYDLATGKRLAKITTNVDGPRAVAAFGGTLYIGNSSASGNYVSAYRERGNRFTPLGTFGAYNGLNTMAVDGSGNVYVAYVSTVDVYSPRGKKLLYTISKGLSCPNRIAFDLSGDVLVSNYVPNTGHCSGDIAIYGPNESSPLRVITQALDGPVAMSFDKKNHIYVASQINDTVSIYDLPDDRLVRTIRERGSFSLEDAVSSANGTVYVANGYVYVYAPRARHPDMTISNGIDEPVALALKD